jgi:hypothetical protein
MHRPSAVRPEPLIRTLEELKMRFDGPSATLKCRAIRRLRRLRIARARSLEVYHDALCVIRAYPQNRQLLLAAERELRAFGRRIDAYTGGRKGPRADRLLNSGITGTAVVHPFSLEMAERLTRWHPHRLEIAWDDLTEQEAEAVLKILTYLVGWTENDALDYDPYLNVREWLARCRGTRAGNDLETILHLVTRSGLPRSMQRHLFDGLDYPIRWELGQSTVSRSKHRLPSGRIYFQKEPRRRRSADFRAELRWPATPLRALSTTAGQRYIRAIQEVMAVRNRELFPITFANPAEVYLNEPGRGIQFLVYGMVPEMRLPFESNFGAMIIRNGLPVGYGIAAPWFDRSEIAINVFPAFRSGESAYIFEQFFRIFYHHFGARAFFVRSHQMGEDDEEPLQSGAFWFYYKLGFRATNLRVRELAEREHQRITRERGYRCSIDTLKRMSGTDVYLHVDASRQEPYRELSLVNLAYAVTEYFGKRFNGDRARGTRHAMRHVARALDLRAGPRWSRDETTAFERLAPLLAGIPDLHRWSADQKRDLTRIIRAKGGRRERGFVLLCIRHARLRAALDAIARRGPVQGAV